MARNYSCGQFLVLCGACVSPGTLIWEPGLSDFFASIDGETCWAWSPTDCSGQQNGCGGGSSFSWSSSKTSVASVYGSSTSSSVNMMGNSPGTFNGNGTVCSAQCCSGGGEPGTVITLSQSPATLSMSSGDTNQSISVTIQPSTAVLNVAFSTGLSSNPNSSSQATFSVAGKNGVSGTQSYPISVSGVSSPSGIFNALGCASGVCANQGTVVTVPPQVLIQVLYGEAHAQAAIGDSVSEPAIGTSIKNRFGKSQFPGGDNRNLPGGDHIFPICRD